MTLFRVTLIQAGACPIRNQLTVIRENARAVRIRPVFQNYPRVASILVWSSFLVSALT